MISLKRVGIALEDDVHKAVKMKLIQKEKTMKEYIAELIEKDLRKEKEQTH